MGSAWPSSGRSEAATDISIRFAWSMRILVPLEEARIELVELRFNRELRRGCIDGIFVGDVFRKLAELGGKAADADHRHPVGLEPHGRGVSLNRADDAPVRQEVSG